MFNAAAMMSGACAITLRMRRRCAASFAMCLGFNQSTRGRGALIPVAARRTRNAVPVDDGNTDELYCPCATSEGNGRQSSEKPKG